MTTHSYRITGQHPPQSVGPWARCICGSTIWDFGPFLFDEIASTATDDDGPFEVEFTQPYYAAFLPFHHHPHLVLKLFRGDQPISPHGLHDRGLPPRVDRAPQGRGPHPLERPPWRDPDRPQARPAGCLRRARRRPRAEGTPLADVLVKAFDEDLRQEYLLGETTTDPTAHYLISYTSGQFHRPNEAYHFLTRLGKPLRRT